MYQVKCSCFNFPLVVEGVDSTRREILTTDHRLMNGDNSDDSSSHSQVDPDIGDYDVSDNERIDIRK